MELTVTEDFPEIYLARHGETEWSATGRHTGRTDIPLTARGEENAKQLGHRLQAVQFTQVLSSPLARAWRTCELAGFGGVVQSEPLLMEFDYGAYEGRTTADIRHDAPGWDLYQQGCPGGETVADVTARIDQVLAPLRQLTSGRVLIFAHMHVLLFLAARWIELPGVEARRFFLGTAALSTLGYRHGLDEPIIRVWNDAHHLATS